MTPEQFADLLTKFYAKIDPKQAVTKVAKARAVAKKKTQQLMAGDPAKNKQPIPDPQRAAQLSYQMVNNSLKKKYQVDPMQVWAVADASGGGFGSSPQQPTAFGTSDPSFPFQHFRGAGAETIRRSTSM